VGGDVYLRDLAATPGGGLAACGILYETGNSHNDAFIVSMDDQALPTAASQVGDSDNEEFSSIVASASGGLAVAGYTTSLSPSNEESLVAHTDADGMVEGCSWFSQLSMDVHYYSLGGSFTSLTSASITPMVTEPAIFHTVDITADTKLCSALPPTVSASITAVPAAGTLPFSSLMLVTLSNNYNGQTRRMAARIDLTLGNGNFYSNWRGGYTNIGAGQQYDASWTQSFPALATVLGENRFHLQAEDVTPLPYNAPPYPPAGDTDTGLQAVMTYAP
jgi:hypothetical protein